jgi:hypothetical protein
VRIWIGFIWLKWERLASPCSDGNVILGSTREGEYLGHLDICPSGKKFLHGTSQLKLNCFKMNRTKAIRLHIHDIFSLMFQ